MSARRLHRLAFASVLCILASAASAERKVEVYRPRSRTAADLLAPAQAALGGEGSAAIDPGSNALVLIGEPPAVAAALTVLRELDRAAPTVVLRYQSERLGDLEARGVTVAWSAGAGSVRVGNVHAPAGEDLLAIRPFDLRMQQTARLAGLLRIQDGRTGRIESGAALPVVERVSPWEARTSFVSASSGFEATPRVQPDGSVRVILEPFEGRLGADGVIHASDASTEVTVPPGETVAVGGLSRPTERRAVGTSGARSERGYEDWVLLLRAEVEGTASPAAPR